MTSVFLNTYSVKESSRAKSVRLKLSLRNGLTVVVPKGFDQNRIPVLLERKKRWLEKATERIEVQRKFFEPEPPGQLPERLNLRSIGEEWAVDYRPTQQRAVTAVERPGRRLLVYGDIDNIEACKNSLKRWLNRKAHEHLKPWLQRLASENGFVFNQLLIKGQRTRWASCSKAKTISLNMKLLFISEELVRYVFTHELCHTVYLNHSSKFWTFLKTYDEDYANKDEKIRLAWRNIPAWLDVSKMRFEI